MDPLVETAIQSLMAEQHGVVNRRQVHELGGTEPFIERQLRRRYWARALPGVYVDHTGPLSVVQRQLAAVLYAEPAALALRSALVAHGARNVVAPDGVEVAVDWTRRVRCQPGVVISRLRNLDPLVQWQRTPPRLRVESAVLLEASERLRQRRESDAIAVLADVCQQRLTTAGRLVRVLKEHHRKLFGRRFLLAVLCDVATGTYSVLEHLYLTKVERPHGLPRGERQQGPKGVYRDVTYRRQKTLLELDGRLGHEWDADRWDDWARDIAAAGNGQLTLRAGYGQVLEPCRMARGIARILTARGWRGTLRPCPDC